MAKLLPVDYLVKCKQRMAPCSRVVQNQSASQKSSAGHGINPLMNELNHPNLIVNGLILTNGQKIAQI